MNRIKSYFIKIKQSESKEPEEEPELPKKKTKIDIDAAQRVIKANVDADIWDNKN